MLLATQHPAPAAAFEHSTPNTAAAVPVVAPTYTTKSTGGSFYLNTTLTKQAEAEAACKLANGHLATYTSMEEQEEVEQFFTEQGYLLPGCHRAYWLGLVYNKVWPEFV